MKQDDARLLSIRDQAHAAIRDLITDHYDRVSQLAKTGLPEDETDRDLIRAIMSLAFGDWHCGDLESQVAPAPNPP